MGTATGRPRGRPPGAKNKSTLATKAAVKAVAEKLASEIPDAFDGDAHALLMLVYKDRSQPMDLRLDAAKASIRFEKPALAAVDISQELNATVRDVTDKPVTEEQWAAEVRAPH